MTNWILKGCHSRDKSGNPCNGTIEKDTSFCLQKYTVNTTEDAQSNYVESTQSACFMSLCCIIFLMAVLWGLTGSARPGGAGNRPAEPDAEVQPSRADHREASAESSLLHRHPQSTQPEPNVGRQQPASRPSRAADADADAHAIATPHGAHGWPLTPSSCWGWRPFASLGEAKGPFFQALGVMSGSR